MKSFEVAVTAFGVLDEMVRQLPASVTVEGNYGCGVTQWRRFRDSETVKSQTKDDKKCRELKSYARDLQNKKLYIK